MGGPAYHFKELSCPSGNDGASDGFLSSGNDNDLFSISDSSHKPCPAWRKKECERAVRQMKA